MRTRISLHKILIFLSKTRSGMDALNVLKSFINKADEIKVSTSESISDGHLFDHQSSPVNGNNAGITITVSS